MPIVCATFCWCDLKMNSHICAIKSKSNYHVSVWTYGFCRFDLRLQMHEIGSSLIWGNASDPRITKQIWSIKFGCSITVMWRWFCCIFIGKPLAVTLTVLWNNQTHLCNWINPALVPIHSTVQVRRALFREVASRARSRIYTHGNSGRFLVHFSARKSHQIQQDRLLKGLLLKDLLLKGYSCVKIAQRRIENWQTLNLTPLDLFHIEELANLSSH